MTVTDAAVIEPDLAHGNGIPEVPEPGRVVNVRGSTWAVADVREQALPRSPADESQPRFQHLVALQSLDEDRLGEELTVVGELEVGHSVSPEQGLPATVSPDAFDDPHTLGAFVDAVRWGAVTSADPNSYQAPFRSGANVEAYQLEPLRRVLQAPRTNLLLADDVGLGKTIEAGLVIQELLLRHRARTVVIVCPPSLSLKWQDEMREKFGLDFVIVDSALMAQVRRSHGLAANPFRLFPRVIVSMAWLPSVRAQRLLRDVYAEVGRPGSARRFAFDALVVDEAHHVAPASPSVLGGGRGYAVDSHRTIATRELASRCEHRLFLTATPHNGHTESFTALLEMVDNRRFSRGATLDEHALREVAVRRLKSQIADKAFQPRQIKTMAFEPTREEQEAFEELSTLLADSARANGRERSGDIVALLLKKRFLSSPWAFARTLDHYQQAAATGRLADADADDEYYAEVLGSGQSDEEEGLLEHPELVALRQSKGSDPLVAATPAQLDRLLRWARGFEHRPNSRLTALLRLLDSVCRPDTRTWTNERVVVFSEYADTLTWIVGVLTQHGYGPVLATITGATPTDEREVLRQRFSEHPAKDPMRVLVATDAAGEGIDLQAHCHRLVSFDVPFNPSRLEQRIGRIDRYGQRFSPEVYYLAPTSDSSRYAGDLAFLRRIAEKVSTVASDLGSVNQLIDGDIQAHFLRSGARRRAEPDRSDAIVTKALAGAMDLNRQLTELSRTYVDVKAGMHLTPFNARRVVDTALRLTAQPPLEPVDEVDTDAGVFAVPPVGRLWQSTLAGLDTRLKPGVLRPITFDGDAARGRTDVVHVHLGHALLQKSARLLRAALYGSDSGLHRVTAVVVDDLPASCVAAVSRLVLVGRGGLRLHEEVFLTGVRLSGRGLAEEKVHDVLDQALDAQTLRLADEPVRRHLADLWNVDTATVRARLQAAIRDRAAKRQDSVRHRLDQRRAADLERAAGIFDGFAANLRESLDRLHEEELLQLPIADDQRAQRRRDIRAMEARLDTLEDERARELAGIRERYADVAPYVSTAALVFAVTPQDAATWAGAG